MPTFNPPTRLENPGFNRNDPGVDPAANRIGMWFGPYPVGKNVARVGGTFQIVGIRQSSFFDAAGVEGEDWFLGGHVYDISQSTADELTAAGFEVT